MKNLTLFVCAAIFGTLAAAAPAPAQFPDKFTNLKVLPKDISKNDLQATMRGFSFALGVRCEHCHVQNPDKSMDFPSDQKETKATARLMLQMVAAVNRDYVANVKDPDHTPYQVECATCHHGLTQPRQLKNVLADDIALHGAPHALALYDELRGKYNGTGAYDFGEATLNQLTESLLAQNKNQDALAFMEKNFAANHPDSVWSFHMLAMTHQANGQLDKALADYRKVLELHPDDSWAAQQIKALSARLK
jgi:tetratricopeptide (TPR) repeat protein